MAQREKPRFPNINLAPLLLRDLEDLASQSKARRGQNGEGLYARSAIIIAVVVLEHFIDLYLDRTEPEAKKRLESTIKNWRTENSRVGSEVGSKWYEVVSHYTLSAFPTDAAPFADLKRLVNLRNRLVHLSQRNIQSRNREGVPNLLREANWRAAEHACETVKAMISSFYREAGKPPPSWLNPQTTP